MTEYFAENSYSLLRDGGGCFCERLAYLWPTGSLELCDLAAYYFSMFTITMSAKGQFVLPKSVREHLKLLPGAKVDVTVDEQKRLILTPAVHEPEELFRDRPPVKRIVSVEGMDRAIAKRARGRV